jgi:hypothetical protein
MDLVDPVFYAYEETADYGDEEDIVIAGLT